MRNTFKFFLMATLMTFILIPPVHPAAPKTEAPQYGGTLTIFEMYPSVNPMTWDNAEWNWRHGYDTSLYIEHLLVGDLQKGPRGTKQFEFNEMSWFPPQVVRGELIQKWETKKNPPQIIFHLRKGIMWQEKPGVMKAREFVADDVVYSMERLKNSRRAVPEHIGFIDRWEVIDQYTLIMHMKQWCADWQFRMGWGANAGIQAPEQEKAPGGPARWENACGTGPYMLTEYKDGHSQIYSRNPMYWDSEVTNGKKYQLPFTDKVIMMLVKDEATQIASLRTGKVDLMINMNWKYTDELKKNVPQLQWKRCLEGINYSVALRLDKKPFNDIRVRRALNMAVNRSEIIKSFYGGNAEIHTYPVPPTFGEIYTPLEKLPPSVRELFVYNPEKAKKLLAEAGYPNGFSFKIQIPNNNPNNLDLASLVVGYLDKIGVKMELEPMDYPSWLSVMTRKTHPSALFFRNGHGATFDALRKNLVTGQMWNPSMMSDPYLDKTLKETTENPNLTEKQSNEILKKLTIYAMNQVPVIMLPQPYVYVAWWPWVKNYYGERRAGQQFSGPIWARVWIDQEMKKKMGF